MREAAQSLVSFQVLDPFASCLITIDQLQDALDAKYNEIYIWHNGQLYQHMQLKGNRYVRCKVDHLPARYKDIEEHLTAMHTEVKEAIKFLPEGAGKIPFEMWDQIVEFFRQVMKIKSSEVEAHAWILWSEEKGYYISIPKQVVSKASVGYTWDSTSVPAGSIVILDVHSHNTMGAFFSGTDNNDDKDKLYYTAVVGKLTADNYEWAMRFNLRDKKFQAKLEDVFDMEKTVEIPKDWLDQVEIKTYSTPTRGPFPVSPYIGGPKNMTPGSTPQNPAKWTASGSIEKGGADTSTASFPRTPTLWDMVDGSFGYDDIMGGDTHGAFDQKNSVGSGTQETPTTTGSREEIAALLRDTPSSMSDDDLERLDRQATQWLRAHGMDDNGDPVGDQSDDARVARGVVLTDEEPELTTAPQSEHYEQVREEHGQEVADNYELVDALVTELEGVDEALMDIATQCYHLMSKEGQMKIQTNGF